MPYNNVALSEISKNFLLLSKLYSPLPKDWQSKNLGFYFKT